ncbi:LPXTG cell wall anchor domain-containing protein [Enterococcus cecorum]|uniref:LPXTG cell wall anchor domain-containing protein n=1 Tax=Enterococcus cecorum TaxID=44008 RepID=UPI003D7FAF50
MNTGSTTNKDDKTKAATDTSNSGKNKNTKLSKGTTKQNKDKLPKAGAMENTGLAFIGISLMISAVGLTVLNRRKS